MLNQALKLCLLSALSVLAACGGGESGTPPPPAAVTLSSISIEPANAALPAGLTEQYTAMGVFSDGSKKDVTASASWSSANSTSATINAQGLASAVAAGSSAIGASLDGVSGSTPLTVTDAALVSIGVTPATPSIAKGTSQQFAAVGVYTDNSTLDLTSESTWSSSDASVASISNDTGAHGMANGLAAGTTTVRASFQGTLSPAVALSVREAELVSLHITGFVENIPVGTGGPFVVAGIFTDGSSQVMTQAVSWTSSNPAIASISNSVGTEGNVTGLAVGTTQVSAARSGIVSPAVALDVIAATLTSISVTPSTVSPALGTDQQFTATGTYTDSSIRDLTAEATWQSSNTAVASIANSSGSSGLATSLQQGNTTITAQVGAIRSGDAALTVTAARLVSLAIGPLNRNVAVGSTQQYTASGTYTDNSTQDLTTAVTWTSSNTTVAQISNDGGSRGLASALANGTTTITAALDTITQATSLTAAAHGWSLAPSLIANGLSTGNDIPVPTGDMQLDAAGRVLFVNTNVLPQIFDPANGGQWSVASPFPAFLGGVTTAAISPGKLLAVGGQDLENLGGGPQRSSFVFDMATGNWTPSGNMVQLRSNAHVLTLADNRVLVVGGGSTQAEVYDPVTGSFTAAGSLPSIYGYHGTITRLQDGRVLLASGLSQFNDGCCITPIASLYDPVSGTWSATGSLNVGREGATASLLLDGRVLVTGGQIDFHGDKIVTNRTELYDPATGAWTEGPAMNTARVSAAAVVLPDGRVLISGGQTGSNAAIVTPTVILASSELFDPATGTWSNAGDLSAGRSGHRTIVMPDGRVLAVGNYRGDTTTVEVWQ
jgi:hypothetical protein